MAPNEKLHLQLGPQTLSAIVPLRSIAGESFSWVFNRLLLFSGTKVRKWLIRPSFFTSTKALRLQKRVTSCFLYAHSLISARCSSYIKLHLGFLCERSHPPWCLFAASEVREMQEHFAPCEAGGLICCTGCRFLMQHSTFETITPTANARDGNLSGGAMGF